MVLFDTINDMEQNEKINLFGKINFINGQREDARRLPFEAVLVFLLWAFPFLGLRGLSVLPVLLHEDRLGFFLGRS